MHTDIIKSLEVLRAGGVILYPTDTIWGLGCDATNPEAVQKIYDIKKRADNKSMIILMDTVNRISSYVDNIPDVAYDLIELSEKPLTVILEGAKMLAHNVVNSDDDSIGIRVISEPFSYKLIQRFKKPIVSTSANITGAKSPINFNDISADIINQVDYVVNYRQDDLLKSVPSGIIKVGRDLSIKVIRE